MRAIRSLLSHLTAAVLAGLLLLASPSASGAAPLTLGVPGSGSGPGNDALLDVNSWFVFADQTVPALTMISLTSGTFVPPGTGQFGGTVQVTAECCFDTAAGKNVQLPLNLALTATTPGAAAGSPGTGHPFAQVTRTFCFKKSPKDWACPPRSRVSQTVIITAGQTVNFNLSVAPIAAVPPGRYAIIVSAVSVGASPQIIAANVGPILNVLPALPVDNAEMPAPCPSLSSPSGPVTGETGSETPSPTMEVLLLRPLIRGLFALKAADPAHSVYNTTLATVAGTAAWRIVVMPPPTPLPPNMTLITIDNEAGWDKVETAFSSTVCPHATMPTVRVPTGTIGAPMLVDLTTAKTILLRRQACANWLGAICTDTSRFDDIAIFSETNFAALFGGRAVTLIWYFSQGE